MLNIANSNAVQNSTVTPSSDNTITFASGITTANFGGLSGTGAFALTNAAVANVALSVGSNNASTTFSSSISGGGRLTKVGSGTLTLSTDQSYSGSTTVNGGTLAVNGNLSSTALVLGGGTLSLSNGTGASFTNGTTLNAGSSGLNASSVSAGNVVLNAISRNAGSAINFTLPTASNFITTTTANTAGSILGGWSTVAGTDWAVNDGAGNIIALAPGGYTADVWAAGNNTDVTVNGAISAATTNSVRFNANSAITLSLTGANVVSSGGILETVTVGANAIAINGGQLTSGSGQELIVNQFNTAANPAMTISSQITDNGNPVSLTKAGTGTLILTGANNYTGNTYIGGGTLQIGDGAVAGVLPATGSTVVNGTLAFVSPSSATIGKAITGTGVTSLSGISDVRFHRWHCTRSQSSSHGWGSSAGRNLERQRQEQRNQ